jgi:hypothetical protein
MADTQRDAESTLHFPAADEHDPFWDQLGRGPELGESELWVRVDGIGDTRVYFRREITEKGPAKITGLCIVGDEITQRVLREIPTVPLENFDADIVKGVTLKELPPLRRSEYKDDPEGFTETVAFYYRVFVMQSNTPAKAMAEHSSVPVATMHAWIREARLRGQLPPGRRGKAG